MKCVLGWAGAVAFARGLAAVLLFLLLTACEVGPVTAPDHITAPAVTAPLPLPLLVGDTQPGTTMFDTNGDGVTDFHLVKSDLFDFENFQPGQDGVVDQVHFDANKNGAIDSPPEILITCLKGVKVSTGGASRTGLRITVIHCVEPNTGRTRVSQYRVLDTNGDGDTADAGEVIGD